MVWSDKLNDYSFGLILLANAPAPPGTGRQAGARTTWLFGAALGAGPAFAVRFKSEFRTRTSRLASL